MFIVEIGLIVNAPIIMFVMFKAVRSTQLNWDAIRVVANYVTEMPTLTSVAAATFIFTGISIYRYLIGSSRRISALNFAGYTRSSAS